MSCPSARRLEDMRKSLQGQITGDVLWGEDILRFYSVDSSSYQVMPDVVVIPADIHDVTIAIRTARQFLTSVTARGAGTSLVGGALNSGIILDMRNLDSVQITENYAVVGPGTSKGKLDELLLQHGKFFAPNPSIGRYCSVGGMLANNSSGSRSLKYGSMIDNVVQVTFVDGTGATIMLPQDTIIGKKILEIAHTIDRGRFPNVTKNSAGYRLDRVTALKRTHEVITGSEGTLGVVTSAKLKIRPIPRERALYVVGYKLPQDAAADCQSILKTGPAATEFVDAQTLLNFHDFDDSVKCLLFIEYDSDLSDADRQARQILRGQIMDTAGSAAQIQKWWDIRDTSLHYSIKSIQVQDRVPHVIEDAVVPVRMLGKLFDVIESLNKKFGTSTIIYGHAGNGNIHVRLLSERNNPRFIRKVARYYFECIMRLGGSITGEHGDGLARTWFLPSQYGMKNYVSFQSLKAVLDPYDVLNPGKIVA